MNIIENIKNYVLENLNENEKNELTFDILNGYNLEEDLQILIDIVVERIDYGFFVLTDNFECDFKYEQLETPLITFKTFEGFELYYFNYIYNFVCGNDPEDWFFDTSLKEYKIQRLDKHIERFWYKLLIFVYKQVLKKYEYSIYYHIQCAYYNINEFLKEYNNIN